MKHTLVMLGQSLGKRKTDKQKLLFINTIAKPLLDKGIAVQIHRNPNKRVKSNNVHIGDMDACKTVMLCPYDTGRALLIENGRYYPCDNHANSQIQKHNLILETILGIIAAAVIYLTAGLLKADMTLRIIGILIDFAMFVLLLYLFTGPTPSTNMNRNSGALALTVQLSSTKWKKTAFILTDQSIDSKLGYVQVSQWYKDEADSRTFIMLDGLAHGDTYYVIGREGDSEVKFLADAIGASPLYLNKEQIKNSPLALFKHAMLICAGTLTDDHCVMVSPSLDHRDYEVDTERLEKLKNDMAEYIDHREAFLRPYEKSAATPE